MTAIRIMGTENYHTATITTVADGDRNDCEGCWMEYFLPKMRLLLWSQKTSRQNRLSVMKGKVTSTVRKLTVIKAGIVSL